MKTPRSKSLAVLLLVWIACVLIGAVPAAASLFALSLVPSSDTIEVGETVTVDLVASGLTAGGPPSIGSFDIDLHFDQTILQLDSVEFGTSLGDPTNPIETSVGTILFGPGGVGVTESSYLAPATLDALQGSSFTLVTLSFTGVGVGSSLNSQFTYFIDDAFGNELCGFTECEADSIRVQVNAVPEPSSFIAFAVGIFVVGAAIRQKP